MNRTLLRNTLPINPLLKADFPDPSIIRVDDTYYMASTTMHFMPGCTILRSYDLIHWEIYSHVYERLEDNPQHNLEKNQSIYGQGMWAPSFRHYRGTFYLCFSANDTRKTYLFQAKDLKGPWERQEIEGFYHDLSLFFEGERVFLIYGNSNIYIQELNSNLKGPMEDGLHRLLVKDKEDVRLGYEGSHLYKIKGYYYLFLIHWHSGPEGKRTQACFKSLSLEGSFDGGDILDDDMGYHGMGIAQGGIIDTPEGDWYALLFQDRGAVGRIPVLVPLRWENQFPALGIAGKVPENPEVKNYRPDHDYAPVVADDDFSAGHLSPVWQWNHNPQVQLWSLRQNPPSLALRTADLRENPTRAVNVLTQRSFYPQSAASVLVDGSGIKEGDFLGICAFQGLYGMVALGKDNEGYYIVMKGAEGEVSYKMGQTLDLSPGREWARIPVKGPRLRLRVQLDFTDMKDRACFYYQDKGKWVQIGIEYKLHFGLDHFTGCRFGLFYYSTESSGGEALFQDFRYEKDFS